MERKFRGRLRLFPEFSEFLDYDRTSNPLAGIGEPIALINQHQEFGEFGEGSRGTFP